MVCGFIVGYFLGLLLCVICDATQFIFQRPIPIYMIFVYPVVFAVPTAALSYMFPKTMRWIMEIFGMLPLP